MASEIRVDKINSLSGVGTVTLSPTGVDIAGITTAATLRATTGIVTSLTAGSLTSLGAVSGTTGTFTGNVAVSGANITLQDSGGSSDDRLVFGAGSDLSIYHDATHSYLKNDTGSLRLSVAGGSDEIQLNKGAVDEYMARFIADGAVQLYHNNAIKLATTASGIELAGVENAGAQFKLGASGDFQIEHDASNTYVANSTGDLVFQNDANVKITAKTGGTQRFRFDSDGLKFGTDTAAANALDDYEEGSFTPKLGGTSNSGTYNVEGTGTYIKIGRKVTVAIRFNNVDLDNNASGTATLFNLPFTSGHAPTNGTAGVTGDVQYYNVPFSTDHISNWYINTGSTAWIGLISRANTSWDNWPISDFHAGTLYVNFAGTYFTAA